MGLYSPSGWGPIRPKGLISININQMYLYRPLGPMGRQVLAYLGQGQGAYLATTRWPISKINEINLLYQPIRAATGLQGQRPWARSWPQGAHNPVTTACLATKGQRPNNPLPKVLTGLAALQPLAVALGLKSPTLYGPRAHTQPFGLGPVWP